MKNNTIWLIFTLNIFMIKFQKSCEKVREWDTFLLQMRYDLNIFSKLLKMDSDIPVDE